MEKTAKKIVMVRHFEGLPRKDDFELVEEVLPPLQDNEVLVEAMYFSISAGSRPYAAKVIKPGDTMFGCQVGRIVQSKHPSYPVGQLLIAYFGWRSHTIFNPDEIPSPSKNQKEHGGTVERVSVSIMGNLSPSVALGAIGVPGNTAYFGFLEICQPKPGDVVVISGAAGAVGHLVGQIAKMKGCYVIGYTGSDEKAKWLVEELGFDQSFNYKTVDWNESLREAAPNGIDCYFDMVGGLFSATVRNHMKNCGRISVCGSTSTYNDTSPTLVPASETLLIMKQIKMEGFVVTLRWADRWKEGLEQMATWIKEGKIKQYETITEGFENLPKAFIDMLLGRNMGKAIVKV